MSLGTIKETGKRPEIAVFSELQFRKSISLQFSMFFSPLPTDIPPLLLLWNGHIFISRVCKETNTRQTKFRGKFGRATGLPQNGNLIQCDDTDILLLRLLTSLFRLFFTV